MMNDNRMIVMMIIIAIKYRFKFFNIVATCWVIMENLNLLNSSED